MSDSHRSSLTLFLFSFLLNFLLVCTALRNVCEESVDEKVPSTVFFSNRDRIRSPQVGMACELALFVDLRVARVFIICENCQTKDRYIQMRRSRHLYDKLFTITLCIQKPEIVYGTRFYKAQTQLQFDQIIMTAFPNALIHRQNISQRDNG